MRFADILTTASAVASYLGAPEVSAGHMLHAIAIQAGSEALEDLGRPVSPLIPRGPVQAGVAPAVREVVRRWFERLGGDAGAELDEAAIEALSGDLRALIPADGS